jgi:hypothetical protein
MKPEAPHCRSGKYLLPCQGFPDKTAERPDCRSDAAGSIFMNVDDDEQIWMIDRGCPGTAAVGIFQ